MAPGLAVLAGNDEPPVAQFELRESGPWGQLLTVPIAISPPTDYIPRDMGAERPLAWYFPTMSPAALEKYLLSLGLSRNEATRLRETQREAAGVGTVVTPDVELVRGLSPEVRARVYLDLGRFAAASANETINLDQVTAFRYFGSSVEAWLNGVSPEIVALVEPYVYRHNGFLYFADLNIVRPSFANSDVERLLVKDLLRQETLLVALNMKDASNVDAISEYWGRGGRRTDIRPLIESIGSRAQAHVTPARVDIVHLLPTLPRENMYRYPKPTIKDLEKPVLANCLWTALNFFNAEPDDRYLDTTAAIEQLKTSYYLVYDNFQLGDIVAFSDARGGLVHVAVYLADDLVFGKNGASPMAPWTILPLERLAGHYVEYADTWRITYHRLKGI